MNFTLHKEEIFGIGPAIALPIYPLQTTMSLFNRLSQCHSYRIAMGYILEILIANGG